MTEFYRLTAAESKAIEIFRSYLGSVMIENSLVRGDIFGSQIADSCLDSKWLARFCLNGSLNIGYTEISVGQLVNPNIVDKNPVVAVIILAVNGAFEY